MAELFTFPTVREISEARRVLEALVLAADYGTRGPLGKSAEDVYVALFNDVVHRLRAIESNAVAEGVRRALAP